METGGSAIFASSDFGGTDSPICLRTPLRSHPGPATKSIRIHPLTSIMMPPILGGR